MKKKILYYVSIAVLIVLIILVLKFIGNIFEGNKYAIKEEKPVIYLYPEQETQVSVKVNYKGDLFCTYPLYKDGWKVTASPDGSLINQEDGKEYSYLFWEGKDNHKWDLNSGFVVKGEQTAEFLQEKLAYLGLTPKEYNEFIVYWLPKMIDHNYNLIHFAKEDYEALAQLEISPKPDTVLRVFMVFQPLDNSIDIEEQQLESTIREGFTVVEWGGTEVSKD